MFKIGDIVKRIKGSHAGMSVGDVGFIFEVHKFGRIRIFGYGSYLHDENNLEFIAHSASKNLFKLVVDQNETFYAY